MRIKKRVLCPQRVRRVPAQFSWIDQRLVRERGYLQGCSASTLGLYLVLVTVGDAEGLSYYSEATLGKMLGMDGTQLAQARAQLCQADLIVYEPPLYQVLSLEKPEGLAASASRAGQSLSAAEILRRIVGGER